MLKGLGDLSKMGGLIKQAVEMKGRIEEVKEQLENERVEASAGGGMVTVVVTGKMDVVSVKIDPEVIDKDDPEMLETLIRAAFNEAAAKSRDMVKSKMTELTGGFEIPGLT